MVQEMIGPVILDLKGLEVTPEDRALLQHPLTAGVILFSRNYESPAQLIELCRQIRACRTRPTLIAVDHEGGRVQRFHKGFTRLPPMRRVGEYYQRHPEQGLQCAEIAGWLAAAELFSVGINLTFAPVLDLDRDNQTAIGDRAFSAHPEQVIALAKAFIQGMHQVGMAATGKHFPGHGSVPSDTHKIMPVDPRAYATIEANDMVPFASLIKEGIVDAIMPAHILFSDVDEVPVGFSKKWLKTILRQQLGFQGVIISDDLNMEGAAIFGSYADRARAALQAGCDIALICNNRAGAINVLDQLSNDQYLLTAEKVKLMAGQPRLTMDYKTLTGSRLWIEKNRFIIEFFEKSII